MITLTFLYHEYTDRPKLSEQKENPFEYIVPPAKWGRNKEFWVLEVFLIGSINVSCSSGRHHFQIFCFNVSF